MGQWAYVIIDRTELGLQLHNDVPHQAMQGMEQKLARP